MKLGISTYTFGWAVGVRGREPKEPLEELGLLEIAVQHGVHLLQIGDNLPPHTFGAARLQALGARAKDKKIQIEVGARGLTPERFATYAAIARKLEASLIRFVIDDADYHPKPKAITATLRELAPMLDGLILGIENHDRFPASVLRKIIEDAGDERIGVCLDTANSLGAGEGVEAVASILAPLTVNLHIKDFSIERVASQMGFHVSGRPAGAGMLNIPALLETLAPFNRCDTAILELWTPPEEDLAATITKEDRWAAQSLEYLKPFFPKSL